MTSQNGRAFNEWLRAQLKAKKMSQRQLAQQSGVDHSTISRLIRGDRMPSLGTATKLARGLRELRDDAEAPQYLGTIASASQNPTARVEYALRADELLSEPQVRQVMEYYLAVRMRRFGRAFQPADQDRSGDRSGERLEHMSSPASRPNLSSPVRPGMSPQSRFGPTGRPTPLGSNGRPPLSSPARPNTLPAPSRPSTLGGTGRTSAMGPVGRPTGRYGGNG